MDIDVRLIIHSDIWIEAFAICQEVESDGYRAIG